MAEGKEKVQDKVEEVTDDGEEEAESGEEEEEEEEEAPQIVVCQLICTAKATHQLCYPWARHLSRQL